MERIHRDQLAYKGEALLPFIAYGDAAGLPVETKSAQEIADRYGRIEHLIASSENPFFEGSFTPGFWSDDTQLSVAVVQGLMSQNGFSLEAMAREHLIAYDQTPDVERKGRMVKRGWGGSTIDAMEKLRAGVSAEYSGTKEGAGNGVLMKVSPLVYWQTVKGWSDDARYEQYDQITTMTHDSDVARLCTRVHGDILQGLLQNGYLPEAFLANLEQSVVRHTAALELDVSEYQSMFAYLALPTVTSDEVLRHTDAKGFYAPQTLAMAYGAFMSANAQMEQGVYEAVNLGGDTDSTASIVATMALFASREPIMEPADFNSIDQLPKLTRISGEFARLALTGD